MSVLNAVDVEDIYDLLAYAEYVLEN